MVVGGKNKMTNAAAAHPRVMACRLSLCIAAAKQRSVEGSGRLAGLMDNARRCRLGRKCRCGCVNTCASVTAIRRVRVEELKAGRAEVSIFIIGQ